MKAKFKLNSLRAYTVFAVVVLFLSLVFSACKKPDPVVPIIPELKLPIVKTTELVPLPPTSVGVNVEIVSNGGEAITASGVCWIANRAPTIADNTYPVDVFSGTYSIVVTNLEIKTTWYIRAYATNKNGTGYGQALSFFYAPPAPKKAVLILNEASNVTTNSAAISGVLIPNETDTKASFEYQEAGDLTWRSLPITLNLEFKNPKDSIKVTTTLASLKIGTSYSFRLKANNVAGETVSDEKKFLTYAVADFDGNFYHAIEIGGQTWLKENLRTTKYANGYFIVNVEDPANWGKLIYGAYSWYNNDLALGKTSGALYSFYVGINSHGLIKGYHVPTIEEWRTLSDYLKSYQAGQATGLPIMEVGSAHWLNLNQKFIATNLTGFTALPNGEINLDAKTNVFVFAELGLSANFWSSSLSGTGANYARIDANDCLLNTEGISAQNRGFGIRLIKDK